MYARLPTHAHHALRQRVCLCESGTLFSVLLHQDMPHFLLCGIIIVLYYKSGQILCLLYILNNHSIQDVDGSVVPSSRTKLSREILKSHFSQALMVVYGICSFMYDHPAFFAEHFLLHFAFVTAAIEAKRICQNHTEINDCCVLLSHRGAILAFLLRFLLGPISKHAVIKTL